MAEAYVPMQLLELSDEMLLEVFLYLPLSQVVELNSALTPQFDAVCTLYYNKQTTIWITDQVQLLNFNAIKQHLTIKKLHITYTFTVPDIAKDIIPYMSNLETLVIEPDGIYIEAYFNHLDTFVRIISPTLRALAVSQFYHRTHKPLYFPPGLLSLSWCATNDYVIDYIATNHNLRHIKCITNELPRRYIDALPVTLNHLQMSFVGLIDNLPSFNRLVYLKKLELNNFTNNRGNSNGILSNLCDLNIVEELGTVGESTFDWSSLTASELSFWTSLKKVVVDRTGMPPSVPHLTHLPNLKEVCFNRGLLLGCAKEFLEFITFTKSCEKITITSSLFDTYEGSSKLIPHTLRNQNVKYFAEYFDIPVDIFVIQMRTPNNSFILNHYRFLTNGDKISFTLKFHILSHINEPTFGYVIHIYKSNWKLERGQNRDRVFYAITTHSIYRCLDEENMYCRRVN